MAITYASYGALVKPMDFNVIGGKRYKTVKMPDGKIWMAENLDFKFCTIGGSGSPTTPNAWYYGNNESIYGWEGNKYGLLYNWHAVKLLIDYNSELCPGWHVPTAAEWDALATTVGGSEIAGTKLKSTTGWSSGNGDGSYNFAAFPAGNRTYGGFYNLGDSTYFWTSTETSSTNAYSRSLNTGASMISYNSYKTDDNFSVRLVKDTV